MVITHSVLARVASAAAILLFSQAALAQLQPNRPVRIVTSGIGGGTDFTARQIASGLAATIGQPVVVENRGSSVVPGDVVAKAVPDGHTLLLTSGGILWVLPFFQNVPYDAVKDFAPVAVVAGFPSVLAINASVPANSVKEFIAVAKARPGALNHVMTAEGGSAHLSAAMFAHMAGIKLTPIPYKNTGTAITDLISGQVQLFFSASGPVMPHVKAGKLKALGITSAKPSPLLPDLPTIAATLPGYDMEAVYCLFAPASTPPAIIQYLNRETVRTLNQPDVKERFMAAGIEPRVSTPAELGALRKADMARMMKLLKEAGLGPKTGPK
jgi:tripartite-type tricarboxylate transporter receptor subunit TctC